MVNIATFMNQIQTSNVHRWLASRFFSNFAKQMQDLVVYWQVYQLTKDPLALGFLGLSQALPFIGIALWAGHMVDRHEKRGFLIFSEVGHLTATLGLFALTFLPNPPLFVFYVCIGLVGFFSSFENISAATYLHTYIQKSEFPRAAAWNLSCFQAAIISGPLLGGWILHEFTPRVAYGTAAICLLFSFVLATTLEKVRGEVKSPEPESDWERVKSGLRFIRSQPLIMAAMSLDMVAVLFGDCVALFPIFADILGVGPTGLGLLRAAPPIGSLILSSLQSMRPIVRISWGTLKFVVFIFGLSMIGFALSKTMPFALLFLAVGGMADAVSVIVRQSIYQALTPDHLRGRVASVSLIFISSSNEIGSFESGLSARLLGTIQSVLFGGFMTLGTVGAAGWIFRKMERKQI